MNLSKSFPLAWDEMVKESKKKFQRGMERHRVTIPVQVSVFEGNQYVEFSGEASDFSPNGLCLVLTRQLDKGAAISMNLNLPYNSQTLDLRGIVRHRSGFHHGIEFISLTSESKELLERTTKILGLLR